MRVRTLTVMAGMVVLFMFGARQAQAEAQGDVVSPYFGYVLAAAVVVASIDVGFTVHDLLEAAHGGPGNRTVAVAELLLVGPQAGFSSYLAITQPNLANIGFAVWTDLLVAHGIWILVEPAERARPPLTVTVHGITFMPTVVSNGHGSAGGLGAFGRF